MGATIRSGERGANLDSQSGSNQEVVSVAEPDGNEMKEIEKLKKENERLKKNVKKLKKALVKKKANEMKECSDECRSKFRFQLFGKFYLKKMKMMKLMQSRAAKVGSWR